MQIEPQNTFSSWQQHFFQYTIAPTVLYIFALTTCRLLALGFQLSVFWLSSICWMGNVEFSKQSYCALILIISALFWQAIAPVYSTWLNLQLFVLWLSVYDSSSFSSLLIVKICQSHNWKVIRCHQSLWLTTWILSSTSTQSSSSKCLNFGQRVISCHQSSSCKCQIIGHITLTWSWS